MRAYTSAVFALAGFAMGALPLGAQEANPVQVIPYVALGSEIASPVGAAITFPVTSKLSVETDIAYRRGEGDIHAFSLSAGLLYDLPRVGRSTPYVAGGVGLSQYGAPVFSSSGSNGTPIGTQSRLGVAVNAGGGLKVPMNENVDLRTDARWGMVMGRQSPSEFFRVAQGISFGVGKR